MKKDKLSVIVPNYNHSAYIEEALGAILNQSLRPYEVIVIDDCSTDDSISRIMRLAEVYPSVKLFTNDYNMGIIYTANRGLEIATGDYIYYAASDDKVLPGFFEKSVSLLNRFSEAGLCCSDPGFFSSNSKEVIKRSIKLSEEDVYLSPIAASNVLKKTSFNLHGHTVIVKRESIIREGGSKIDLKWYCDWFLYHVIVFREGFCYIPETLAAFRLSDNSYSAVGKRNAKECSECLKNMLSLLDSNIYSDIREHFIKSEVLRTFGMNLLKAIINNHSYRKYLSLGLIKVSVKELIISFSPGWLIRLFRMIFRRWNLSKR